MDTLAMTEDMYMKLTKEQTWELFKGLQDFVMKFEEIQVKLDKIPALEKRVTALESSLAISQNATTLLQAELVKERKSKIQGFQYNRLENVEFSGIPASVPDDKLEEAVVGIAREIGVTIKKRDIAACHRLRGERKDTIVRFPNRKHADALFANAAQLKGKDLTETLGSQATIYMNVSLTPELRRMRWMAKRMKIAGLIEKFGTNRRGVFIQPTTDDAKMQIYVESDLHDFLQDGVSLNSVLYGDNAPEVGDN